MATLATTEVGGRIGQLFGPLRWPAVGNLFDYEGVLDGPKHITGLVAEAIEYGQKIGRQEAREQIKTAVEEKLKEYLDDVYMPVHLLHQAIKDRIPSLQITQTRTRLSFATRQVKIMLLIKRQSFEDEVELGRLIADCESFLLRTHNLLVDVAYLEDDRKRVDYDAVKHDYPFTIKEHVESPKTQNPS